MPEWITTDKYSDGKFWLKLQWLPKTQILRYRVWSNDRHRFPTRSFHNEQDAQATFEYRKKMHKQLQELTQ